MLSARCVVLCHWLGVVGRGLGNTDIQLSSKHCCFWRTTLCTRFPDSRENLQNRRSQLCAIAITSSIFCLSQILPLSALKGWYLGLSQQWRIRHTVLYRENSYWLIFQTTVEYNICKPACKQEAPCTTGYFCYLVLIISA